tara:strand:- start:337 stop:504 length:168 start_codon:yes stop_codon:yes gene_type:complete
MLLRGRDVTLFAVQLGLVRTTAALPSQKTQLIFKQPCLGQIATFYFYRIWRIQSV